MTLPARYHGTCEACHHWREDPLAEDRNHGYCQRLQLWVCRDDSCPSGSAGPGECTRGEPAQGGVPE